MKECPTHVFGPSDQPVKTIVFPGLTHTPGDWRKFAAELGRPLLVPENALHTGEVNIEGCSWEWWEDTMRRLTLIHPEITEVIGSSRGGLNALKLSPDLPQIEQVWVVNTPLSDTMPKGEPRIRTHMEDDPDFRLLDACINPMAPDMDDAMYQEFLAMHEASYGKRFKKLQKKEKRRPTDIRRKCMELFALADKDAKVTLIVGTQDPWYDEASLQEVHTKRPSMKIIPINAGHFPHISKPKELADIINGSL